MVAPAIIGAGLNLIGSLFNKPKPKYVVPDYAGIRAKAEAAGFNPLTALTQGPQGAVVDGGGYMGSAIAEAGMMLADAVSKNKDAGKLDQARSENATLKAKVQALTLHPKVGGVYAQRQSVPTLRAALGGAAPRVPGKGATVGLPDVEVQNVNAGSVPVPQPVLDAGTGIYINGRYVEPTTGYSSAQVVEDNYGESGSEIRGWEKQYWDNIAESRQIFDQNGWTTKGVNYFGRPYWENVGVPKVKKYIRKNMGPDTAGPLGFIHPRFPSNTKARAW